MLYFNVCESSFSSNQAPVNSALADVTDTVQRAIFPLFIRFTSTKLA